MNQSDNIDQLFTALAKAQGEMSAASKDCKGYNYKYADLASVWGACRGPLSQNGLSVTQIQSKNDEGDILVTILGHSSGQWIKSIMPIRVKSGTKNDLQEMGSVLTYLRRYALSAIVGIAPAEDDDGSSSKNYQTEQAKQPEPPKQPQIKMASPKQVEELGVLLPKCSPQFKESIKNFLSQGGLRSLNELSEKMFKDIMLAAVPDMEAYQTSLKEQVA
jgi:hypothetical protein